MDKKIPAAKEKEICYRHQKTLTEVRKLNLCPSSCILGTFNDIREEGLTVCAHLSTAKKLQALLDEGEWRRWIPTLTLSHSIPPATA